MKIAAEDHADMIEHAQAMLDHHYNEVGMGAVDDYQSAMVDLLVYLQHFAHAKGISFADTLRFSQGEFEADEVTA